MAKRVLKAICSFLAASIWVLTLPRSKGDDIKMALVTYPGQGARQESDRKDFICLFKNRISFYVQIYIYLHKIYILGPQILRVHKSLGMGWKPLC